MGKKQGKTKGKFDNVEISRPLLSAEMIKAIHTPPNQKQKEGGFKALFADSGSHDLLNDIPAVSQHLPSYVGISCAISGYTNYSPYLKSSRSGHNSPSNTNSNNADGATKSTTNPPSMTSSPLICTKTNHLTHSVDNSRFNQLNNNNKHDTINGRLTPNITGSDTRRAPSPSIPRVEDDRHHGTCVGARYCLLPAPDKSYHKHIPLLGIDDDKVIDDAEADLETEANKSVQKRIASLYGNQFAEGWKESNANKARREGDENSIVKEETTKYPKDLVKLKPTPTETKAESDDLNHVTLPDTATLSKAPVFAGVEKQFLGQLLSNGVSIQPTSQLSRVITSSKTSHAGDGQLTYSFTEEQVYTSGDQMIKESANIKHEDGNPSNLIDVSPIAETTIITDTKKGLDMDISDTLASLESKEQEIHQKKNRLPIDEGCLLVLDEEEHVEIMEPAPIENTQTDTSQNHNDLLDVSGINIQQVPEIENDTIIVDTSVKLNPDLFEERTSSDPQAALQESNEKLTTEQIASLESNRQSQNKEEENLEKISEINDELVEVERKQTHSDTSGRDGKYFLEQLELKSNLILKNVEKAEAILKDEGESLDEENLGKVHSAIGKANLLLNKKCKQFEGLCANNLVSI